MTYYAVENYLRKFRKDAKDMRGQAPGAAAPSPAKPRVKKAGGHASPARIEGIKTGRVAKKKPAAKVKTELLEQKLDDMGSEKVEGIEEEV
jgi:hypothetical protein